MQPELIADAILATLLIAALAAMWRLESRLQSLRAGQGTMAQTASDLIAASARAENAIKGLRLTAEGCGAELDGQIRRARGLADELAMLVERSHRTAGDPLRSQRVASAPAALHALTGTR